MKIEKLVQCFDRAIEQDKKYVAVMVTVPGCNKNELIVNHKDNFMSKLAYYKKAYNEDCVLNNCADIKIVAVKCTDKISLLESWVRENE